VGKSGSGGMVVLEGAPAGDPIPLNRESVAAFVGPAPRGPVNIPVAVRSVAEYLRRFGSPDRPSRLEQYLSGFFDNGGTLAVVVRVSRSQQCNRLRLAAGKDQLVLQALHPGPLEHLRASVDYDQIAPGEGSLFNLVIHRLDSGTAGYVAEQEIHRRVSADSTHPEFVGHALLRSQLVRLLGEGPGRRPNATIGPSARDNAAWVYVEAQARDEGEISDYDLIGSIADGTGLYALEQVPTIDLLCLLSPAANRALGPVAGFAAERYCQRRNAMLVMPPPDHWRTPTDILRDQQQHGLNSPNVITWFPELRSGSATGPIMGALSAGDARGEATPASLSLRCAVRPDQRLALMETATLHRAGVNTLVRASAGRLVMSGGVSLGGAGGLSPEWVELRLRRRVLRILGAITRGSRWVLFPGAEGSALDDMLHQCRAYLQAARQAGWLAGDSDAQAWYLHCSAAGDAHPLRLELGIAPRRAGEFLAFRIVHTAGDSQVRELGWQPVLALAS
jgi:hypothetical protein